MSSDQTPAYLLLGTYSRLGGAAAKGSCG